MFSRSPNKPIWWKGNAAVTIAQSDYACNDAGADEFSFQSSLASPFAGSSPLDQGDRVFVVPVAGSETPLTRTKMPGIGQGSRTPEVQSRLANAPAENVQGAALEMYRLLKENGLASQAEEAFKQLNGVNNQGGKEAGNSTSDLWGMDLLLKDGVVNYLRNVSKISPPIPRQVVRFNGINLTALQVESPGFETFGKKLLGPLGPFLTGSRTRKKKIHVLKDLNGYIMPGTMTLLLGPPGSGKSSLLKVLAGRCKPSKTLKLEGTVMYNENLASEILLTRLIAYINGQLNRHLSFLTVRETLEFAEQCSQGIRPEDFTPQMRKFFAQALVEGQDPYVEYVLRILGMKGLENQLVGGISDADKNRLTTAEIAMGTYAVMLYDQPCYGQDSVATYDLVYVLRAMSRLQQCSVVMSLIQVSSEAFQLYDRVILLAEGHIIYQGPRQDVLHYFSQLGFVKPSHVESAAFLQDIAAGEGGQYVRGNYKELSVEDLAARYLASSIYADVLRIVTAEDPLCTFWIESEPAIGLSVKTSSDSSGREVVVSQLANKTGQAQGIESTGIIQEGDIVTAISKPDGSLQYIAIGPEKDRRGHAKGVKELLKNARGHVRLQVERRLSDEMHDDGQFRKQFCQGWYSSTKILLKRQTRLAVRLQALAVLRLLQALILGVFGGTIFYHFGGSIDQAEMSIVRAIGFVSTFSIMLINVVQLPVYMLQRPVFYKQRAQKFFRVSSYLAAQSIVNAPQSFIEAFVYTVPVYFLSTLSLERSGLHFFQFLCLLFLVAYMGSFLVIFLSAVTPGIEAGNSLAGLLVSLSLLFSGFVIFPSLTPKLWRWMLTANPLRWGNLIFCMSEFVDRYKQSCRDSHFQDFLFCRSFPELTVGRAFLRFFQFEDTNYWFNIGYLSIVLAALVLAAASYLGLRTMEFSELSPSLPSEGNSYSQVEDKEDHEKSVSWNGLSRVVEISNLQEKTKDFTKLDLEQGLHQDEEGPSWRTVHIPVKPVALSFYNLTFSANEQVLLDRVSGYAKPGSMLAIMGSGSMDTGKSLLLKCLAQRVPPQGELKGDVLANGYKVDSYTFSRISGFVEKLDAHQPFLTVKESLDFSAGLRFGASTTNGRRALHVDLILELMGLVTVKDQLVGSLKFVAGKTFELAKKLTIAVELAANPSILFLEDPTSDLDSVATRSILHAIQTVAVSGRTIVATIQQPNARVLSVFNNVLILKPGGEQVYFGPVGWNCQHLVDYFSAIPKTAPQSNENPLTFVLDVLGARLRQEHSTTRENMEHQNFSLIYKASQLGILNAEELKKLRKRHKKNLVKPVASAYAASYATQAWLVYLRTNRFLWRNVTYTFGRLSGSIALGLLLGSVFYNMGTNDTFSVTSRALFIYIQVMLLGVVIANNIVPQLGTDRLVYFREKRAAMYSPIFYPVSWAVAELPYLLVATLTFVGIANGMARVGTSTVGDFLTYWLAMFVFTTTVMYFGMFITIATSVPMVAAFIVSITSSIWVSATGVIVPRSKLRFYEWLYFANPFQYVTHALTVVSFFCDTGTPACSTCRVGNATSCAGCTCPRLLNAEASAPGSSPIFVWNRLSSLRSLDYNDLKLDFVVLGGMSVLFALLAFASFVGLKHNRS